MTTFCHFLRPLRRSGLALGLGVIAATAFIVPAHAEPETVTSRIITVERFMVDPSTRTEQRVARWPWLNYRQYYEMVTQGAFQPVIGSNMAGAVAQADDKLIVTERGPKGDDRRRIVLQNGTVSMTYYAYDRTTFVDTNELHPYFLALRDKAAQSGAASATPQTPALLTIQGKIKGRPFLWQSNDKKDVDALRNGLRDLPRVPELDQRVTPNNYDSDDAISIAVNPSLTDLPQLVDLDSYQVRVTDIISRTRLYVDAYNMWKKALQQKAYYDDAVARGITNPRPIY